MDSSEFLPEKNESSVLLPSFQLKERIIKEKSENIMNEFNKLTIEKDKIINKYLLKKYF